MSQHELQWNDKHQQCPTGLRKQRFDSVLAKLINWKTIKLLPGWYCNNVAQWHSCPHFLKKSTKSQTFLSVFTVELLWITLKSHAYLVPAPPLFWKITPLTLPVWFVAKLTALIIVMIYTQKLVPVTHFQQSLHKFWYHTKNFDSKTSVCWSETKIRRQMTNTTNRN